MENHDLQSLKSYLEAHSPFNGWLQALQINDLYKMKPELLIQAMTHSSFVNENQAWEQGHNERLEFLGDAILDAALSRLLFERFSDLSEGQLSRLRSSLVNEETLWQWGVFLGIPEQILLGKGEAKKSNVEKAIVADCLEALFGAISLIDESAVGTCLKNWISLFDEKSEMSFLNLNRLELFDPKSRLQELTLERSKKTPTYDSVFLNDEEGFESTVFLEGVSLGKGRGSSKKKAEIEAAKSTLVKHFLK